MVRRFVFLALVASLAVGAAHAQQPRVLVAPVARRVPLQPATGVHDLYFVFTNADTTASGFLFAVMTASFEAKQPGP